MPNTPFNINYTTANDWSCNPTSQTVPKSTGATFTNNDNQKGCIICFQSSTTFGQDSLTLNPNGQTNSSVTLPFATGATIGSGTAFGVYDSDHRCGARVTEDTYPYDVTIGSGVEEEGDKKKRKAGVYE